MYGDRSVFHIKWQNDLGAFPRPYTSARFSMTDGQSATVSPSHFSAYAALGHSKAHDATGEIWYSASERTKKAQSTCKTRIDGLVSPPLWHWSFQIGFYFIFLLQRGHKNAGVRKIHAEIQIALNIKLTLVPFATVIRETLNAYVKIYRVPSTSHS